MKYLLVLLFSCSEAFAGFDNQNFKSVRQEDYQVSTSSVQVASLNANRKYLIVINSGSTSIYVKMGSAHTQNEGVLIPAGGNWEPKVPPAETVYAKSASSTDVVKVVDGE